VVLAAVIILTTVLQCGATMLDRKVPTFQKKKLLPKPSVSSSAKLEGSKLYIIKEMGHRVWKRPTHSITT
jgi:hypothetical protein